MKLTYWIARLLNNPILDITPSAPRPEKNVWSSWPTPNWPSRMKRPARLLLNTTTPLT